MPPTNIQPEKRFFNNQHEFIYLPKAAKYDCEGITGGKLGWTRQACHTMVTVAERDGRALIAVVMKCASSKGKYTDTTSLLDYGFNSFNKSILPADKLSLFIKGQSDKQWSVGNVFGFLLHKDIPLEQVKITLAEDNESSARLEFSLPENNGLMYEKLGSLELSPR